jgi:uncharacterized protein (DUF924 family)
VTSDTEKVTEQEFSDSTIELSRSIWNNLSKVNVNEHTETKNGLTYLSWAWAYGIMMEHYPGMTYRFYPTEYHNDGSATVHCSVMIRSGEDHVVRSMWLPVMDFRNKAVVNPSSVDINKAKMRCLTKCFSQFGKKNKKVIDRLDNDFPDQYQRVKDAFTTIKEEISK